MSFERIIELLPTYGERHHGVQMKLVLDGELGELHFEIIPKRGLHGEHEEHGREWEDEASGGRLGQTVA